MAITVFYGRYKASILPEVREVSQLSQTSLLELKKGCSLAFNIPESEIRLIYAGVQLKNDLASLASYGINFRSKILMLRTQAPADIATEVNENTETNDNISTFERRNISEIENIVSGILNKIGSQLSDYPRHIHQFQTKYPKPPTTSTEQYRKDRKRLEDLYLIGNESLVKALLKLDGISAMDPNLEDSQPSLLIRDKRKGSVNKLQALLDGLENQWKSLAKVYPKL